MSHFTLSSICLVSSLVKTGWPAVLEFLELYLNFFGTWFVLEKPYFLKPKLEVLESLVLKYLISLNFLNLNVNMTFYYLLWILWIFRIGLMYYFYGIRQSFVLFMYVLFCVFISLLFLNFVIGRMLNLSHLAYVKLWRNVFVQFIVLEFSWKILEIFLDCTWIFAKIWPPCKTVIWKKV